jgi:hypothetical protein
MSVDVVFAANFLVDEVVFALVAEDDVHLLGSRTANVGAKHDFVRGLTVHLCGLQLAVKNLGVTTAAVNVLLVLDGELDDQGLVFGAERLEFARECIETSVFRGLQT